jgi:hypothetical protein
MSREARGNGTVRGPLRTTVCVAALTLVALFSIAAAGAVTITSASAVSSCRTCSGPISTSNLATTPDEPHCSGTIFGIRGTGFLADGGFVSVYIGNVPARRFEIASDVLMFAQVDVGATSGPIIITTSAGWFSTDSLPGGRLSQGFPNSPQGLKPGVQIVPCPRPPKIVKAVVTSIAPKRVAGGKKVQLTGSGFIGVTKITVGGKAAPFAASSDQKIVLIVPRTAKKGELTVVLETSAGVTTSKVELIKTTTRPAKTGAQPIAEGEVVVTDIRPNPSRAGARVVLRGFGFYGVTKITVGGEPALFFPWSDGEVVVVVPKRAKNGSLSVVFTKAEGGTSDVTASTVRLVKKG